METYTDQTGQTITLPGVPRRIISLVPSQTELLSQLGLNEEVVGITRFCVHPNRWYRSKTRVGGTKDVNAEKIRALSPELILANKEENDRQQIIGLREHYPVWTSDINTLSGALAMIREVGRMTATGRAASAIALSITEKFDAMQTAAVPKRIAYLIWQHPYMAAGGDTFIHDMLSRCGWINIFADRERYPVITLQDLKDQNCGALLLSSEPFPFRAPHAAALRELLPGIPVVLVDGEMFSWYGSRLQDAPGYFAALVQQV
jgi:ABC-type Fe3+-hydroxamate transport system substrate-binding protein